MVDWMKVINIEFIQDEVISWWLQIKSRVGYWTTLLLFAVPACFLIQILQYERALQDPSFISPKVSNEISQVVYQQGQNKGPVSQYIATLLMEERGIPVMYERENWVKVGIEESEVLASFFSGDFAAFGITAYKGTLEKLENNAADDQIVVALSYDYWKSEFKNSNAIGVPITINGSRAVIGAVLPESFQSFRRQSKPSIVIPYVFQKKLLGKSNNKLSSDSFSYTRLTNTNGVQQLRLAEEFIKNELIMFDDETMYLSKAIGVSDSVHKQVENRLGVLIGLFLVLLVFSLFSLISYLMADNERRQNEIQLRQMIGANATQIRLNNLCDILGACLIITLLIILIFPLSKSALESFLPQDNQLTLSLTGESILIGLLGLLIVIILLAIVYTIQQRFLSSSIGRGVTPSKGQKLQMYTILSMLVGVSCVSLSISWQLMQKQWQLQNWNWGFNTENMYLVSFDFPKFGGTFYANDFPKLLVTELEGESKIERAAITGLPMLSGRTNRSLFYTPDMQPINGENSSGVLTANVTPNYFETTGTKITEGNSFGWDQYFDIVVSKTLWERYFSEDVLGQAKLIAISTTGDKIVYNIVGIADDVFLNDPDDTPEAIVYSLSVTITGSENIIVRSKDKPAEIDQIVNEAILNNIGPLLKNPSVRTIEDLISKINQPKIALLVLSVLCSVLLSLITGMFILNAARLLINKSSREIALKLNFGGRVHSIALDEIKRFTVVATLILSSLVYVSHFSFKQVEGIPDVFHGMSVLVLSYACFLGLTSISIYRGVIKMQSSTWEFLT